MSMLELAGEKVSHTLILQEFEMIGLNNAKDIHQPGPIRLLPLSNARALILQ